MSQFRFILEPYVSPKSKYRCPSCNKKKTFTRYIDTEKNEYLAENVGRCDRIQKCGYHYPPKDFFQDIETLSSVRDFEILPKPGIDLLRLRKNKGLKPSFINEDHLFKSLQKSQQNNFLLFLDNVLNPEALEVVKEKYKIGTSQKWPGATIFWQIDNQNRVRTGKIIQYNKETGKKSKINWVHSMLKLENFSLKQCLFGLHLLNSDKNKPIALVESEKSAIIASIAFPEFIWMATGGLMNLKYDLLKPLAKRKVILFPDAGCYDLWNDKVKDLPKNIHFMISDLVKKKSSKKEKDEGWDIVDYIIPIWQKG
ncbi:DUF6371 domain-containing protein [Christiangramia aquimixticola]|uniref:DUF6371 domain-containing protein n=1 Tax=Christiangramia aquimixticola TaxID=1697558 RepID=UPI003AA90A40